MATHPTKILVSSVSEREGEALPKKSLSCMSIHVVFLIKSYLTFQILRW